MRIIIRDPRTGQAVEQHVTRLLGWRAWMLLAALAAAVTVVAIPIIALGVTAVVVGGAVLAVLALVALIVATVRGWWLRLTGTRSDGRENVIVMRPGTGPRGPFGDL